MKQILSGFFSNEMLKELDAFVKICMKKKLFFFGIVIFQVILSLSSSISPKEISNLKRICCRSMEVLGTTP